MRVLGCDVHASSNRLRCSARRRSRRANVEARGDDRADQTVHLVMELLDGIDLESLVRQHGPLPAWLPTVLSCR
jgi:hypothetical protein